MTLVVGTDTYATIAEANSYIESHFISTDTQRVAWTALADGDKEIYLRNATDAIESVQLQGKKYDYDQSLSFPRCYRNEDFLYGDDWYTEVYFDSYLWYCETEVSDNVKNAQIMEALELASPSSDSKDYDALNGATQSFSITGLSKTYKNSTPGLRGALQTELRSKKAQKLLSKYAEGGFHVS